ncbi:hypothetical protein RND81_01G128200 [Saponaria officinalis]|uniref:Myb-like domain-containing protein n=1 Tax=Saponaria officinalis TaxID=3572 RepID=A0AAW1NDZ2_SAPOF
MDNNNRNYGNNPYSQDNQNNQFNLNNLPLDQNFLNSPQGQMLLQMLTNPIKQNYSNNPSNFQNQFQQSPTIYIPQQINQPIEHSPGGNESSNRTPSEDLLGVHQLEKNDSVVVELFADEGNKDRSGRVKWSIKEDESLVSAYLHGDLWKTITRLYEEAREDAPTAIKERTFKSLTSRWDTINRDVSRWVGVYAQAQRDKASGQSNEDVENHAHYLYQQRYNGIKFTLMHAWKEMRHMRKWQAGNNELPSESGGSSKISQPDTPTDNPRPEGIKKAKRKGKQVASSCVNMDSFTDAISEMNVRTSNRESLATQMLEYQKERDAARAKQKEDDRQWQLYMFLLGKTHLQPAEKVTLDNLKEKFSYMFN